MRIKYHQRTEIPLKIKMLFEKRTLANTVSFPRLRIKNLASEKQYIFGMAEEHLFKSEPPPPQKSFTRFNSSRGP